MKWTNKPDDLKGRDVIICSVVSIAVMILGPDQFFRSIQIDWLQALVVFISFLVAGGVSVHIHNKKYPTMIDPFYTRGWLGLIGGIVALPFSFFFRDVALPVNSMLVLISSAEVMGNLIYRKFWKFVK